MMMKRITYAYAVSDNKEPREAQLLL